MEIKLNFINNSNDANDSSVVVFQKNQAAGPEETIAWKVIKTGAKGTHHPFTFPSDVSISADDHLGNTTPRLSAELGQQYAISQTGGATEFKHVGASLNPELIQVRNSLKQGHLSANVWRDGRLVARSKVVGPEQVAEFSLKPSIWIGPVGGVQEGEVLNSAIVAEINTEISLLGIASADIVMTGGGSGAESLTFKLENVAMAL